MKETWVIWVDMKETWVQPPSPCHTDICSYISWRLYACVGVTSVIYTSEPLSLDVCMHVAVTDVHEKRVKSLRRHESCHWYRRVLDQVTHMGEAWGKHGGTIREPWVVWIVSRRYHSVTSIKALPRRVTSIKALPLLQPTSNIKPLRPLHVTSNILHPRRKEACLWYCVMLQIDTTPKAYRHVADRHDTQSISTCCR